MVAHWDQLMDHWTDMTTVADLASQTDKNSVSLTDERLEVKSGCLMVHLGMGTDKWD